MTIRVLVVDDSRSMRGLITATLHRDAGIQVVGEAADPLEARQAIKALDPDVVTLDVEMPAMSGLDFLERLMRLRPTPVIMVSSLTRSGAATTLEALEIGAVDCVSKAAEAGLPPLALLAEKVRAAAQARVRPRMRDAAPHPSSAPAGWFAPDGRVLAIGSSTGGVEALIAILSRFPANCPPTLVTQHMPPGFTRSLAERLNRLSAPEVSEARDGAALQPGRVFLAPGGTHLELSPGAVLRCRLRSGAPVTGHRPSVDVLFGSVARVAGARALGVILTGMGRDGAQGLLAMRQAGADTLGQDEASCVVYGMPRAAYEAGAVAAVVPLGRMAERILHLCTAKGDVHARSP